MCSEVEWLDWRTGSLCDSMNCAEVAMLGSEIWMRQSANPLDVLVFTRDEWKVFVAAVKSGEFD
jgi:hypothetical protein